MAKAKKKAAPRARFNTGSTKIGGEVPEPEQIVPAAQQLKESERFFIDNNASWSDSQLAVELGKTVQLISDYRSERSRTTHANRMLHRPAKGVVAMTEASSMATEDRDKNYVFEIEVKRAIAEGDLVKAAELQAKVNKQREEAEKKQKVAYGDRVHYIR
jgi:hypothetical protein